MKKLRMIVLSILVSVAAASTAHGELEFHLDFGQDGTYDDFWRLRKDEVISIDIYVSNVPEPGLISMGFVIEFDSSLLGVFFPGTKVDEDNWPVHGVYLPESGQLLMVGSREPEQAALSGDNMLLATVVFKCLAEGMSELRILGCEEPQHCFVLDDEEGTVLDREIPPEGLLLARLHPTSPGDINWDGEVDLSDAILAFQTAAGIRPANVHANADVNKDKTIGLAEAIFILQKVAAGRL